jgi:ubiquinone biosynthesis protein Coq4
VYPVFGQQLKVNLENLRQWTEVSRGYVNTQELLEKCVLGPDNVIECREKMTDLGAQAWRVAADIYLLCRFFR